MLQSLLPCLDRLPACVQIAWRVEIRGYNWFWANHDHYWVNICFTENWSWNQCAPVKKYLFFDVVCELQRPPLCNHLLAYVKLSDQDSLWPCEYSLLLAHSSSYLLPSVAPSRRSKEAIPVCFRKKQTGSVLTMAVGYPQYWGFLLVFCTSASVHFTLPLSFRCNIIFLAFFCSA